MPPTITRLEWVVINDVPMMTPAWEITDLSSLHDEAALRGTDRIIPGATGVIAYPRRRTVTIRTFPLVIYGDRDDSGSPIAEPQQGLIDNREYLTDALSDSPDPDGTVLFEWHRRDSTVAEAHVTVLGFRGSQLQGPAALLTTLDLSFRDGITELSGS